MVKGLTYRLRILLCGWLPKGRDRAKKKEKENKRIIIKKVLLYFVENTLCSIKILKSLSTHIEVSCTGNENFTAKKLKILSNTSLFIIIYIIIIWKLKQHNLKFLSLNMSTLHMK